MTGDRGTPLVGTTPVSAEGAAPGQRHALGRLAARGAMVTVGAQLLKIVVQTAGVVVLARLLTPGDYGLVAMVLSVVGLAEIFRDFGLSAAAVQAEYLSKAQRDLLFWINSGAGALLMLVVMACAPLLAAWYERPELVDLTRAISVIFFLNGLATQYRADLNRRLLFSRIAAIDVSAPVLSLVAAVALGAAGAGYWALAVQQIVLSFVLLVGAATAAGWVPGRPRRGEPLGGLLTFGWQVAGSQVIGYVGNNIDSLVIGTRFGAAPLGLYNRAFQLLMTPLGQLRQPTTTVALPVLSRLRSDPAGSNTYVQRGQLALGLTLVTGLGLVIGAAQPITQVFLGPQWTGVEPVLRLLAAAGAFSTLAYVGYWVYLAHALTQQLLRFTVLSVAIKVVCILVGSHWGVVGVAWGYAISHALEWPFSFWWLSRASVIDVRNLVLGGVRIIGLTVVVAVSSWLASEVAAGSSSPVQLLVAVSGAVLGYALTLTVPIVRRDVVGVVRILRQGVSRRVLPTD